MSSRRRLFPSIDKKSSSFKSFPKISFKIPKPEMTHLPEGEKKKKFLIKYTAGRKEGKRGVLKAGETLFVLGECLTAT